jgi:uncharacterized protein YdeI (BOF family)
VFKKTIAIALIAVVTCLSGMAQAQSEPGGQAQGQPGKAASVKARMQKIGVGERTVVRVKLKDGTELRGYLSRIENDSFTITDKTTKKATSASYGDVASLKGKGLSTRAKVVIVVAIGVVVTIGVILGYAATHLKI